MPFNNEITIDPLSLMSIMQQLKRMAWSAGPVIIRDLGESFQVRDTSEHHIFSLPKNEITQENNIPEEPG